MSLEPLTIYFSALTIHFEIELHYIYTGLLLMCGLSEIEDWRPKHSIFQGDAGGAAENLDSLLVMKKLKEICHFQGNVRGTAKISDLPFVKGHEVKSIIFKGDAGGAAEILISTPKLRN